MVSIRQRGVANVKKGENGGQIVHYLRIQRIWFVSYMLMGYSTSDALYAHNTTKQFNM